ncbi:MAG: ankyrin repeat domain-containing protein [Longimicrobiaceae bacterium]
MLAIVAAALFAVPASLMAQDAQTRLWDGAVSGDTVAIGEALAAGAQVDSLDTRRSANGRRALNWAALANRPDAIRFLLRHGASIDMANRTGFTPLHHAAEAGSLEAVEALLAAGADAARLNAAGMSAADVARGREHPDVAAKIDAARRPAQPE